MASPAKKSKFWLYFDVDLNKPEIAICKVCNDPVPRQNNTTNLRKHLESKHVEEFKTVQKLINSEPKQSTLEIQDSKLVTSQAFNITKSNTDRFVLEMIIEDLQPFKVVEDRGFIRLVRYFLKNPEYQLSCRKTYVKQLHELFESSKQKLASILEQVDHVALTSDLWTSRTTESYITITIHFVHDGQMKEYVLETKSLGNFFFTFFTS